MSNIAIKGATTGTGVFTLESPATNTDRVLTLPDEAGTLVTTSSLPNPLTSGTAVATTSGTAIDFTGIPSWAKRITVMFSAVSTNGSSDIQLQIGDSGGFETSGYTGGNGVIRHGGTSNNYAFSAGFIVSSEVGATSNSSGSVSICLVAPNNWSASGVVSLNGGRTTCVGGVKALSDTLTQVRITTVNGTDTFDAGSINIMYE